MAINYATSWLVAKAILDIIEETVIELLYKIYIIYRAPQELLLDNGKSFIVGAMQYYLHILETKYRTTIPYHP